MLPNFDSMRAKIAHDSHMAFEARAEAQLERMQIGPHIVGSTTIVIPSDWYNKDAAAFWKSIGATWCPAHPHGQSWILDTIRATYRGRTFTADQWLSSIRRKFKSYWPRLTDIPTRFCVTCGQEYEPWHPEQQFCTDCTS